MKIVENVVSRSVAVAAGVVLATGAAPAAAKDLGTMFETLGTGLEKVPTALTTLMWVLGLGVFIWGLVKLRRSGDGGRDQTSGGAWATVLVGVAFALGPFALGFFASTFGFGDAGTGRPTWGTGG